MKILLLFFIVFCFALNCDGQDFIYGHSYSGKPSINIDTSISVTPNDLYRFDFCPQSISDWFIIYTNEQKTDSILFYVGHLNDINSPFFYSGYNQFEYGDKILIKTDSMNPQELKNMCGAHTTGGGIKVYFRVPDFVCDLHFKTVANSTNNTYYDLKIYNIEYGQIEVSDTLFVNLCEKKEPEIQYFKCDQKYIIYRDSSIKTEIKILPSSCLEKNNGNIMFENYPQFNLYNIFGGKVYNIDVSNSVCKKNFQIIVPSNKICDYFIPNIFTPNEDGVNDEFILYLSQEIDYEIKIYDRWGNFIYNNSHTTNINGWDGEGFDVGVYIYQIYVKQYNQSYNGNITLWK